MINSVSQSPAFGNSMYQCLVKKTPAADIFSSRAQAIVNIKKAAKELGLKVVRGDYGKRYSQLSEDTVMLVKSPYVAQNSKKMYVNLVSSSNDVSRKLMDALRDANKDWVFFTRL